jgi:two-component system CheB/CheR fusion protein
MAELLHALIVDDDPDINELLAVFIRLMGYHTTTAFSAAEALDAARTQRFDLILSDIGMPVMNGYELAAALRRLPDYKTVPMISVTGYSLYDDRQRSLSAGFNHHLTKPIDPQLLAAVIRRLAAS